MSVVGQSSIFDYFSFIRSTQRATFDRPECNYFHIGDTYTAVHIKSQKCSFSPALETKPLKKWLGQYAGSHDRCCNTRRVQNVLATLHN